MLHWLKKKEFHNLHNNPQDKQYNYFEYRKNMHINYIIIIIENGV